MAGNFWKSSHYEQWLLDSDDLLRERQTDLQYVTDDEYQKLHIFFANFIQALGEHSKMRQQVIATSTVYFKRFYARNLFKNVDPLLVSPTCLFLASKVEEFGVISNTRLIGSCNAVIKSKYLHIFGHEFPYRINHILECEFYLLEVMDCCLIVYLPYRSLLHYISDLNQTSQDLQPNSPKPPAELMQIAWRIVNDSLKCDAILLYPPFLIALAALNFSATITGFDLKSWFVELSVDMDKIAAITKQLLALYDIWKPMDERKELPAILQKIPKPCVAPPRDQHQDVRSVGHPDLHQGINPMQQVVAMGMVQRRAWKV